MWTFSLLHSVSNKLKNAADCLKIIATSVLSWNWTTIPWKIHGRTHRHTAWKMRGNVNGFSMECPWSFQWIFRGIAVLHGNSMENPRKAWKINWYGPWVFHEFLSIWIVLVDSMAIWYGQKLMENSWFFLLRFSWDISVRALLVNCWFMPIYCHFLLWNEWVRKWVSD